MEEKNKKVIVPTIIAIVTLVLLTVGATYAYFRVATDNAFGTPKIEASTPSIGSVALSTGSNLTMNLTAEQMMQKYDEYADGTVDYEYTKDVTYYASPSGTTKVSHTENVGTVTVSGEGSYNCTYTLTIDDNENSLYDKFQTGYANKSANQIVLTVNGTKYDFNTANLFPLTIDGSMENVSYGDAQYITAQLKMANDGDIDQSDLSGQNITLTFGVENFSCTATENTFEGTKATDYILANASDEELWDSTLEGDGYRYIGENPNNYVCFGYTDEETDCDFTKAENTDKYAYRVIGIFDDEQGVDHVKLIKKEALNELFTYSLSFEEDELWKNKMSIWKYTLSDTESYITGSITYGVNNIQQTYLHEMNRSSNTYKIGQWGNVFSKSNLLYVSDYLLSLGSTESGLDFSKSWIDIVKNDNTLEEFEAEDYPYFYADWTISGNTSYYWDYLIDGTYYVGEGTVGTLEGGADECLVRPVFYLKHNTTMTGAGTIESPFIVNK